MTEDLTDQEVGETTVLGRGVRSSEMPRLAVVLRWIVGLSGVAVLAGALLLRRPPPFEHFLLFAICMAVLEGFLFVRVAPAAFFSFGPAVLFFYLEAQGLLAATAMVAMVRIAVWAVQRTFAGRKQTALFALFDVGQHILAVLLAGVSADVILPLFEVPAAPAGPLIARTLLFAGIYLVGTAALTSLAVYSRFGFSDVRTGLWPAATLWWAIALFASVPFAVLAIYLAQAIGYAAAVVAMFLLLATLSLILRLNAALSRGNQELLALNRIGTLITATLDSEEIFRIFARESRSVIRWDVFLIATRREREQLAELIFLDRSGSEIARRVVEAGTGLSGTAMRRGKSLVYERPEHGREEEILDTVGGIPRPRSIVVTPLKCGQKVIGAVALQSLQPEAYGAAQVRLIETMAGQAATAIRNAQLFESEERANRERDEFLSFVTHEIRNPLTSIRGYADILDASIRSGELGGAEEAVAVIQSETKRILRLTEDLLDASRMTAGRFSLQPEDTNLGEVVSRVTNRYARTASQQIRMQLLEPVPSIRADAMRLEQVIENLVSNSVKYSSASGSIRVSVALRGDRATISVEDEGDGIPAEKLSLIFQRFYRVEEGESVVKGSGLGLFIAREIVRMHGGTIQVHSTPGQGSRFTVELPLVFEPGKFDPSSVERVQEINSSVSR
ncbi:MAG TPA: ATP-binding protein [Thermoanaerobaculia bacterium]|nr:ATP-binding protein [Thermoanaerobaculia bacterium]